MSTYTPGATEPSPSHLRGRKLGAAATDLFTGLVTDLSEGRARRRNVLHSSGQNLRRNSQWSTRQLGEASSTATAVSQRLESALDAAPAKEAVAMAVAMAVADPADPAVLASQADTTVEAPSHMQDDGAEEPRQFECRCREGFLASPGSRTHCLHELVTPVGAGAGGAF
jgi:hypothetical protein